jgi:hypothetical protein
VGMQARVKLSSDRLAVWRLSRRRRCNGAARSQSSVVGAEVRQQECYRSPAGTVGSLLQIFSCETASPRRRCRLKAQVDLSQKLPQNTFRIYTDAHTSDTLVA